MQQLVAAFAGGKKSGLDVLFHNGGRLINVSGQDGNRK